MTMILIFIGLLLTVAVIIVGLVITAALDDIRTVLRRIDRRFI